MKISAVSWWVLRWTASHWCSVTISEKINCSASLLIWASSKQWGFWVYECRVVLIYHAWAIFCCRSPTPPSPPAHNFIFVSDLCFILLVQSTPTPVTCIDDSNYWEFTIILFHFLQSANESLWTLARNFVLNFLFHFRYWHRRVAVGR